jgi:hypothetical protein
VVVIIWLFDLQLPVPITTKVVSLNPVPYYFFLDLVYVYGVLCHFQQYFSYIVVVVLLVKDTRVSRENH